MSMRIFWILILILSLSVPSARAHQERIFKIAPDGRLDGIPEEYGAVYIKAIKGQTSKTDVTFQIGKSKVDLPPCISKFFELPEGQHMSVKGSWYHDLSLLPPYLLIDLPTKMYPALSFSEGYKLTFNLKNGNLIQIEQSMVNESEKSQQGELLDVNKICTKKERKRLIPVPIL